MTTITCLQEEVNTAAELPERHPVVGHTMEWERYMRLAHYYRWRAPPGEDENLVQAIIVEMASVALRRDGQETPDAYFRGVARHVVADFWRQRRPWPLSLYRPVQGTDGVELWETLAATDGNPVAVLEAKEELEERRYRRRLAAGQCPRCGGQPSEGFVHCAQCRARHRVEQAAWRRRRQRGLRAQWRRQEMCTRCGGPPEPGHRRCIGCLARNRRDLQRWRERRRARTEIREAIVRAAQVLTWPQAIAEVERLVAMLRTAKQNVATLG